MIIQGLDALMSALQSWNGGVIIISHDERFITTVAQEVNKKCLLYLYITHRFDIISFGYVMKAPCRSLRAMSKATR